MYQAHSYNVTLKLVIAMQPRLVICLSSKEGIRMQTLYGAKSFSAGQQSLSCQI